MPWRDIDRADLDAAVHRTVRDVARHEPTVILLEDLHWASAATVELLSALGRYLPREPVLVLGTYRSGELPRAHPVRALRAELRRGALLAEVALAPLTAAETGELLARLLDAPPSPALRPILRRLPGGGAAVRSHPPHVLYCASGGRSALAAATLRDLGYTAVAHLDGGIKAWKQAGLPVVAAEPES